jgi:hypothetical protein
VVIGFTAPGEFNNLDSDVLSTDPSLPRLRESLKHEPDVRNFLTHGKAVQVDPIKPTLKARGTKRLKPQQDEVLSSFAFNLSLRRYSTAATRRWGCPSCASPMA